MRVTNERAEKIKALCKSTNNTNCYGCQYSDDKYDFCPSTWDAPQLATDLLEARETIEKQEAIIKEMRGIIRRYVKLDTKCEVQDNLNSNATSILEKTKEYAE